MFLMTAFSSIYRRFSASATLAIITGLSLVGCSGQVKELTSEDLPVALENKTVSIAPTTIAFADAWLREHRRNNTQADINSLQEHYKKFMTEALEKHLTRQGWIIESTAQVSAQLILENMRITAPDFRGALSDLYAREDFGSGDVTIRFADGDNLIAQHSETGVDTRGGFPGRLVETNRLLNQRAFDQTLGRIVKRMDLK